jgi:hypothetical protein
MDTGLFPDPPDQQEFRDFYLRKYRKRKPHVIITVGPSALKFMKEVHQTAFPGVPIVFCLPAAGAPGAPALDSDFTGVENDMAPAKTLEIALRLRPGTEHVVVVIGGIANFDKQQLTSIKQQLKAFTDHLDITYITELAMPDLLERLRHLPSHTLVLLTTVSLDAAGTRFIARDMAPWSTQRMRRHLACSMFTSRSRILVRPSPLPRIATPGSKPNPESQQPRQSGSP